MVDRTKALILEEFTGKVLSVDIEASSINPAEGQYHIQIKPLDIEIHGKTGFMHDWIRIPETATEETVPEGSVIEAYIRELEFCNKDIKKMPSVNQVMQYMKGKTFKFVKGKLGKAFKGKEAGDHWLPKQEVKQ